MTDQTPHSHPRDPGEISPGRAFVISLLIHALLFLVGDNLPRKTPDETRKDPTATPDETKLVTIEFELEDGRPPEPEAPDIPLEFVWVDPTQASETAPEDTKRYSFANTRASNASPEVDTGMAKIDGAQDKVLRTYDAPREQPTPLQPVMSQPENAAQKPDEQPKDFAAAPDRPKVAPKPAPKQLAKKEPEGNTRPRPKMTAAPAAPPPAPKPEPKPAEERPRTLAEARAKVANLNPGQRMLQEGGVERRGRVAIDAKASPMGEYDARLISAIQQRWFQILDESGVDKSRTGKVVVSFRLHSDGRVDEVRTTSTSLGALLTYYCESAIQDPAPFEKWPSFMSSLLGKDSRLVSFTFFYN